ncbi:MAG: Ig-like domain repeat protein, partial [Actinomycetia bacterium]|nr:Ig-like domain repeat protein [Actinomycetes bacterium]
MRRRPALLIAALTVTALAVSGLLIHLSSPAGAAGTTWQVGPTRTLKTPSEAAAAAQDGDTVEIDAGTYDGDVAIWPQNNLTLRGVGGLAHLEADGHSADDKAIWVIQGDDVTVDSIEFSGASVYDGNGAGIRAEGTGLTVTNSSFHDNEMGLLEGIVDPNSDILIEHSEFYRCGGGDGYTHNLYIGGVRSLTVIGSYFWGANVGNEVKSRAANNTIVGNLIDDADGTASWSIDLPNGGQSLIAGNVVVQGPNSENSNLVNYGQEGFTAGWSHELWMVNNTFVNKKTGGTFLMMQPGSSANVFNNLFVGPGDLYNLPLASEGGNMRLADATGFVDPDNDDYRLLASSPAIDQGVAVPTQWRALWEYVAPLDYMARPVVGPVDVGAYEYGAPAPTTDIDAVALVGLDAPVAGAPLDTTAAPASGEVGYTVVSVAWSAGGSAASGAAAPGTVYTASVSLKADDGYAFTAGTAATLNGLDATLVAISTGASAVVSYEFPATDKAAPTLALSADPAGSQSLPGDVTLTATLAGSYPADTGRTVVFTANGVTVGTQMTGPGGAASVTLSDPDADSYTFGASVAGDGANQTATATPITGYLVESPGQSFAITRLATAYDYGDGPITVSTIGGPGTGAVSFASTDPTVASVDEDGLGGWLVTIHKAGSATITATKAADGSDPQSEDSVALTIAEAHPAMDLSATGGSDVNDPVVLTVTVPPAGTGALPTGSVTFRDGSTVLGAVDLEALGGAGVASLTIPNPTAGPHRYGASYPGQPGYYTTATAQTTREVAKADQDPLTIADPGALVYGGAGFTLGASGGSGAGEVSFAVPSGNGVLDVAADGTALIIGAGAVTVSATKAGDGGHNPITETRQVLVAARDIAEASAQLLGGPFVYTGSAIEPDVTVSDGTIPITDADWDIAYGPNAAVADGGTVTVTGRGNYAGEVVLRFGIAKRPVTVTADDQTKTVGAADPVLTWTADPALAPGDTLTGSLGYSGTGVGDHPITQATPLSNPNYDITFVAGRMRITEDTSGGTGASASPTGSASPSPSGGGGSTSPTGGSASPSPSGGGSPSPTGGGGSSRPSPSG